MMQHIIKNQLDKFIYRKADVEAVLKMLDSKSSAIEVDGRKITIVSDDLVDLEGEVYQLTIINVEGL